jgi:hypothetical protein
MSELFIVVSAYFIIAFVFMMFFYLTRKKDEDR